tara:strand:- start:207 stop:1106 length:900 start_codon:yes stop_codon:yes gene_type:complete
MSFKKVEISIGLIKFGSALICLKRNKKPYEDFIEFPGGKKKGNESPIECLKREITEELNIKVEKAKFIYCIKHQYKDALIIINVFNIHRYSGDISSNENREIVYYDNTSRYNVLPTHERILKLMKLPKLLKIITALNYDDFNFKRINLYKFIRLRDISFDTYKVHIQPKLEEYRYKGNLIVDYPFNENWDDNYAGIHFKSNGLKSCANMIKNQKYFYSASCHTLDDIELSNKILFDFILISPVIASSYDTAPLGWAQFRQLSDRSYVPTYALGGLKSLGKDLSNSSSNKGFGLAGIKYI